MVEVLAAVALAAVGNSRFVFNKIKGFKYFSSLNEHMEKITRREFCEQFRNVKLEDILIGTARYFGYLLHEFNSRMDSIRNAANLPSVYLDDVFPEILKHDSKEYRSH